jgi:hypothetical protein
MNDHDALETFSSSLSGPPAALSSARVEQVQKAITQLLATPKEAPWRAALHRDAPEHRTLLHDAALGWLLRAHTEATDRYRPPHDHGRGWVVYAVERGLLRMNTYARLHDRAGQAVLVRRESVLLRPGDVRAFLPGDIHDTECIEGPLTLLRWTSRDLEQEEITRYPDPRGAR